MQPLSTSTPPAIGEPWPGQGGIYAGTARGRDGQPDHHLILALAKTAKRLTWKAATKWATTVEADGHTDFTLPDRFESPILFGNIGEQFERTYHWTGTQCDEYDAWFQDFYDGYQLSFSKKYEASVRAVRRFPIDPSILHAGATTSEVSA